MARSCARGKEAVAGFSQTGERRRAMRTVKWNPFLSGVCLGGMLLGVSAVHADVTSTNAAALVVFPKILVDATAMTRVETILQLTNTAAKPINVRCFYVNANGHCSDNPLQICDPEAPQTPSAPPGIWTNPCSPFGVCVPG